MRSKPMTRAQIEEHLFDFIEEELSRELMDSIEKSIVDYPDLMTEVEEQRKLRSKLSSLQPSVPDKLEQNILFYIKENQTSENQQISIQAIPENNEMLEQAANNNRFISFTPILLLCAAVVLFFVLPQTESNPVIDQASMLQKNTPETIQTQSSTIEMQTRPLHEVNMEGDRMIVVMQEQDILDLQRNTSKPSHIRFLPTSSLFLYELDRFIEEHQGLWSAHSRRTSEPFELTEQVQNIEITIDASNLSYLNQFLTNYGYQWSPIVPSRNSDTLTIFLSIEYQE